MTKTLDRPVARGTLRRLSPTKMFGGTYRRQQSQTANPQSARPAYLPNEKPLIPNPTNECDRLKNQRIRLHNAAIREQRDFSRQEQRTWDVLTEQIELIRDGAMSSSSTSATPQAPVVDDDEVAFARHEAGHAVVAWALGLSPRSMSIVDDGETGGRTVLDATALAATEPLSRAAVFVAGAEATSAYLCCSSSRLSFLDHQNLDAACWSYFEQRFQIPSTEERERFQGWAHSLAREKLEEYSRQFDQLTAALIAHKQLGQSEILRILQS